MEFLTPPSKGPSAQFGREKERRGTLGARVLRHKATRHQRPPTDFTNANNGMRIAREEIFGPVLTIIPYNDDAEAIAIANDTNYGLSAIVLGKDIERCERVARQIDAGRVLVNTLAHEPRAPFSGFKHSGLGREMGKWGINAYLEPKTLMMASADH